MEIGANTTIDRGSVGDTVIGRGTKIDNLVQIGHNVQVGENTLIVAQVGIAGSTEIGVNAVLGGQAGSRRSPPSGGWGAHSGESRRDW